ncbi:hypothetical protein GCM10010885_22270 [Alicyclobacillus cellulosilyticus]|uniref:Uncharacterized protein n=1 Tax=Alicyclobacillus cellulosilyticus TaxID=1003997 RepID=A0A917KFQ5_9BACL|nr:hypothetical protein [Alicyclobacillus cellulosilyticus]GGJ12431.1 hypothetical protein GCM10010885_22270 [Alicyclobacillus cellulosilyticus]
MPNGPWMNGGPVGEAAGPVPPFVTQDAEDFTTKLAHDQYEVFVNGEFAGRKVLLGPLSDIARDLDAFLASRGFAGYTLRVDGDDCHIRFDDDDTARRAWEHLRIYLRIR